MLISNTKIEELKYSIFKEMKYIEEQNKDIFELSNKYLDFKTSIDSKLTKLYYISDKELNYADKLSKTLYLYLNSYNEHVKYNKSLTFFIYTEHKLLKKYQYLFKLLKKKKDINVKLLNEIEYLNSRLKNNKVLDNGFETNEIINQRCD